MADHLTGQGGFAAVVPADKGDNLGHGFILFWKKSGFLLQGNPQIIVGIYFAAFKMKDL
jgi:hypothetical protein